MAGVPRQRVAHHADWAFPQGIEEGAGVAAERAELGLFKKLPIYNILNGDASAVIPYLVRATLPEYAKWVPIAGMRHEKAHECADAFIRSHIWHIQRNAGDRYNAAQARKAGIILGAARAVIYSNYEISDGRLVPEEKVAPYMSVTFAANAAATPSYRVLADDPRTPEQRVQPAVGAENPGAYVPDPRGILIDAFELTEEEQAGVEVIVKCAQAVIPLQGYGLITEGHHYLSDTARNSYRACYAVEKQHWVNKEVLAWLEDTSVDVRDLLWHKSGHPVAISVKEFAASSEQVAINLLKADLGGAAVRLPAVESEVKAIGAYLRVTNEVKAAFETRGGLMDNTLLQDISNALKKFPRAVPEDLIEAVVIQPQVIGAVENENGQMVGGTTIRSRQELISFAKAVADRCSPIVALCFGYYVAMSEASTMSVMSTGGRGPTDSLVRAYSLKKLQGEHISAFNDGMEYFRDHQSARSKARREGKMEAPKLIIT